MSKMPTVIVATTSYEGKHYAFERWWKAVQEFSYPNLVYLIVDNTADDGNYARKLRRITNGKLKVIRAPRLKNSRDTLSYSQNVIREYVLENNYDYWMSVESDVCPPKHTVEQLMIHGKPLVGGMYEIGFTGKTGRRYCVFITAKKEGGQNGTRLVTPDEHNQLEKKPGLYKVHGCGIGCTLIRSDIIKKYSFWTDERFDHKHSDVYFYMDLWNNHVPVHVDSSIICEHHNSDWSLVSDR